MTSQAGFRWHRLCLIMAGALMLCWPAFWNRYPLFFYDSLDYLYEGRLDLAQLVRHGRPDFNAVRPELYSAAIFLVHWQRSPWGVIFLQAALAAWILWLVVRALIARHAELAYAIIVAVLSALTTIAWSVSWPMPDILGPLTYLGTALLLFAPDALSRRERLAVLALCVWGITSHGSHLVVMAGLAGFLCLLWLLRWKPVRSRGPALVSILGTVVVAVLLQMAVHARMYGKATVGGARPVFLMALVTSQPPGQAYLRTHCPQLHWAICRYQDRFTSDNTYFLWQKGGVWANANPADRAAFRSEETPLMLATLRAYPREEMAISRNAIREQLLDFHLYEFTEIPWAASALEAIFPHAGQAYAKSLQGRARHLPYAFQNMIYAVVEAALVLILLTIAFVWRDPRFKILLAVVSFAVIFNASAAILSAVDWRYQSRVIWLVPFLAMLMVAQLLTRPKAASDL